MNRFRSTLACVFLAVPVVADEPTPPRDKAAEAKVVSELIRQLGAEDFEKREQAVKQLIARGQAVMGALEEASRSKDPELARRARECILGIDPDYEFRPQVLAWIKQLRSSDDMVRASASNSLIKLGPKLKPFVPAVAEILKDPNPDVRMKTVCLLRGAGPIAEKALPELLSILKDRTTETNNLRLEVMNALENMGPPGRQAIPIFLQILEEEEPLMQKCAMYSLVELGREDPRVEPALWKAYSQSKNWDVQYKAVCYLARLRKAPEKVIPAILRMLRSHSFKGAEGENDERGLILSLGEFGPLAEPAIPYLIQVIKDERRNESMLANALNVLIRGCDRPFGQ